MLPVATPRTGHPPYSTVTDAELLNTVLRVLSCGSEGGGYWCWPTRIGGRLPVPANLDRDGAVCGRAVTELPIAVISPAVRLAHCGDTACVGLSGRSRLLREIYSPPTLSPILSRRA